jgi:hypothetical protein
MYDPLAIFSERHNGTPGPIKGRKLLGHTRNYKLLKDPIPRRLNNLLGMRKIMKTLG